VFAGILSLLPLDKVARRIPYVSGAISTARKHATNAITRILDAALSRLDNLSRVVRRETDDIAGDLFEEVVNNRIDKGASLATQQAKESSGLYDLTANTLVDLISDDGGRFESTDLKDALTTANDAADPAAETTFGGSLAGAQDAKTNAITEVNEIGAETKDTFEDFNLALDVAAFGGAVITLAQIGGIFTGGVLTAVATIGDLLLTLAEIALQLLKAGVGWESLEGLRNQHARAVDGIVSGGGV